MQYLEFNSQLLVFIEYHPEVQKGESSEAFSFGSSPNNQNPKNSINSSLSNPQSDFLTLFILPYQIIQPFSLTLLLY